MTAGVDQCRHCNAPVFFAWLPDARTTVAFDFDPSDHGYAINHEFSDLSRGIIRMDKGYYRKGDINGAGEPIFKQHSCAAKRAADKERKEQRELDADRR